MIPRILDLKTQKNSFFLFGPRQVGKTYLIKNTLSPNLYINLLSHNDYVRYARDLSILTKEVSSLGTNSAQVVIDEIQKIPELLNEVQLIMDERPYIQFILTGSSARKLRRAGVNLLGGRANTLHLHPLVYEELPEFSTLDEVLRFGSLPRIILEKSCEERTRMLRSYVETYLKEEIQQEALTRNIPAFSKFLELAAFENDNILNYQNISREVGVGSKVIKEYFNILVDTLVGFFLYPYTKSHRSKLVSHPKFYFFDRGVVSALRGELQNGLIQGTSPFGSAFEHFILLETKRLLEYRERGYKLHFFRTSDGSEVDLILEIKGEIWAVEIKSLNSPRLGDVRGLRSFISDHECKRALCVCLTPRPFTDSKIEFIPWQDFLKQL